MSKWKGNSGGNRTKGSVEIEIKIRKSSKKQKEQSFIKRRKEGMRKRNDIKHTGTNHECNLIYVNSVPMKIIFKK